MTSLAATQSSGALRWCVLAIGVATVLSGALQLALPDFVLGFVAGPADAMAAHFFAIVGMFMLLFGALVLHALLAWQDNPRIVLFWCALQKLGASAAVGIGVARGIFTTTALLIAAFDFISGLVFFWYRAQSQE